MRAVHHIAVGALLLAACEESPDPSWPGDHITIVTDPQTGLEPCGGQVEFTDRLARSVGNSWSPGETFSLSSTLDVRIEGTDTLSGRAVRGSAWAARQNLLIHEIGHLVLLETDGGAAPVFSEGMAELIGPTGLSEYYLPPPAPESFVYLQRPEFSTPEYYLSAQLLSFLARRYGLAAVRDAYQRAQARATPEQIDEAFVEAFGDEVFDAFDDFQSELQCPLLLWQCDDEVLPTMELPFSLEVDPRSCADADIPGFTTSKSDHWYPEYLGVLRLSEPRLIRYRIDNAIIFRQACRETCILDGLVTPLAYETVNEILLVGRPAITEFTSHTRAGDHHLKVRPEDPQLPFSVEIVDVGPV